MFNFRNIYFVLVFALTLLQFNFLRSRLRSDFRKQKKTGVSVARFMQEMERFKKNIDCRKYSVTYHSRQPRLVHDLYDPYVLTRYALSPCRYKFSELKELSAAPGYALIHRSHPYYDITRLSKYKTIVRTAKHVLILREQ